MTHPCPAGQGYAAGVRDRRCLPLRGKSASELARLILGVSRGRVERGALCPSGTVGRRAGRTESAQRFMQTSFLNRRRRQAPARGLVAVCTHSSPKRNESQPVCPLLVGQTGVYSEPTALEAGTAGTAGSARTRSRVQTLENPFLGNGNSFPQNAAGGRPLLVGRPPSTPAIAPTGTNRSAQAPYSWGLGASTSSRRLLAVGPADRPPAEADLALVEDGRLAGSDGALGRVERYARSVSVNDRARGL